MKRLFCTLVLLGSLLAGAVFAHTPALAAGTMSINASCANGAKASIYGSQTVTVRFYRIGASTISTTLNLGGGMSTWVFSAEPGSYSYVEITGTGRISSAGCR